MQVLPVEEVNRIHPLLLADDQTRDRLSYDYAYDILARNCAAPFSIWPMPNADALRIVQRECVPDQIPWEDGNETQKGIFFSELRDFMAQHANCQALCEANGYQPCLEHGCRLCTPDGLCSEFKTAFKRS